MRLAPLADGEAIEVVARLDAAVDLRDVEAVLTKERLLRLRLRLRFGRGRGGGGGTRGEKEGDEGKPTAHYVSSAREGMRRSCLTGVRGCAGAGGGVVELFGC